MFPIIEVPFSPQPTTPSFLRTTVRCQGFQKCGREIRSKTRSIYPLQYNVSAKKDHAENHGDTHAVSHMDKGTGFVSVNTISGSIRHPRGQSCGKFRVEMFCICNRHLPPEIVQCSHESSGTRVKWVQAVPRRPGCTAFYLVKSSVNVFATQ